MPATELSRTKNFAAGLLIVQFNDGHGNVVPHTVNVLGVADVDADIESARVAIERQADAKSLIFEAVGLGS